MNHSDRCCSFCLDPGHNIRTCSDIRIENGWRDILRRVDFIRNSPINDEDLSIIIINYTQTFPSLLLTAIAIKYAQSYASDSVETKTNNIRMWIYREAAHYETLSNEEKGAYRHWIDPGTYLPDGTIMPDIEDDFDDIPDLVTDEETDDTDDGFIPFNDITPIFNHLIQPRLLCTESEAELAAQCECPICFEEEVTLFDMDTTSCEHSFCHSCIMRHLRTKNNCPMCRTHVTTLQVRKIQHYDEVKEAFGPITRNTQFHVFQTPIGTFESSPPLPASILRRLQPIYFPSVERLRLG